MRFRDGRRVCYAAGMTRMGLVWMSVLGVLTASAAWAEAPPSDAGAPRQDTAASAEAKDVATGPVELRPSGHRFTAGLAQVAYSSFFRSASDPFAFEAAWSWLARPNLLSAEVGAGLRVAPGRQGVSLPLEVFARARFVAEVGPWLPAVGPELGVSGLARLSPRSDRLPYDLDNEEAKRLSPFYAGIDAAPLRFGFGHFVLSALEIGLGAALGPPGGAVRTRITLLQVGYAP
ncbi:MAG: hypothetical protein IRZ16_23405 [Myxococcaceae bacterium]|nr:hypothetical protein [Myxococcaceae bacterium]